MKPFPGGMLAGVVSAVIWMAVAMLVNLDPGTIGGGALACLIGVTIVSALVTAAITRSKHPA